MSDWLTEACPQLGDLVDELVQAHLDTIEMGTYCQPLEWQDHLRYLQRLVRYTKRFTAADLAGHPGSGDLGRSPGDKL